MSELEDSGSRDTEESYPGESLGWRDILSRWPVISLADKWDALTHMQKAAEFCERVVEERGESQGLLYLQSEADRLEQLALRAFRDSDFDPDANPENDEDDAWWNAVVFVNRATFYRKFAAELSLDPSAAGSQDTFGKKPDNIHEERVYWCGEHIKKNNRPASIKDLWELVPGGHGGGGTLDTFRKSIQEVSLADGSPVYVKSSRPGRPDKKAEKATMQNMVRFYLERSGEKTDELTN